MNKGDPTGLFESNPWLRAFVPGQIQWDNAVTAAQSGHWGQAAVYAGAMVTEQVVFIASAGESMAASRATQAVSGAAESQIARNAAQGAQGEAKTAAKLGDSVAGRRVTLEASNGKRSVADFVTKTTEVVETKTGGARLSSGQAAVKADIEAGRAVTPRGANAAKAGLEPGKPVQMKCYTVDRC